MKFTVAVLLAERKQLIEADAQSEQQHDFVAVGRDSRNGPCVRVADRLDVAIARVDSVDSLQGSI